MMYTVTWDIDIEADSPEEAARVALAIQRDPDSTALFFKVSPSEQALTFIVDLLEDE